VRSILSKMVVLGVIAASLSGCGISPSSDLNVKKAEIQEWNSKTEQTIQAYEKVKSYADLQKSAMLDYVLKDTTWSIHSGLQPLTKEQLVAFKVKSIVHDKYFTSIGANAVREVLVINGIGQRMYVTIIWGKDSITSLERVVITL
jgi:predicted small lipoprotein YifL